MATSSEEGGRTVDRKLDSDARGEGRYAGAKARDPDKFPSHQDSGEARARVANQKYITSVANIVYSTDLSTKGSIVLAKGSTFTLSQLNILCTSAGDASAGKFNLFFSNQGVVRGEDLADFNTSKLLPISSPKGAHHFTKRDRYYLYKDLALKTGLRIITDGDLYFKFKQETLCIAEVTTDNNAGVDIIWNLI